MRNIQVRYGGIHALKGVDFDLDTGEIHGLVGEHRAGKSTLVKLLSGAERNKTGSIILAGEEINYFTPRSSLEKGIAIVYQHLSVIPALNAVENIFTGHMTRRKIGNINHPAMAEKTRELFSLLDSDIDIQKPLSRLTVAQQQMVEFARVLSVNPRLIILDELSNRLTPEEMKKIYRVLFLCKEQGKSIIYITHDMDEILRLADRITILKDGYRRGTEHTSNLDKFRLYQLTYSFSLNQQRADYSRMKFLLLKKFMENIIDSISLGVVLLDPEHNLKLINTKARELLGLGDDFAVGGGVEAFLRIYFPKAAETILVSIKRKKKAFFDDLPVTDQSTLKLTVVPITDENDIYISAAFFLEDLSMDRHLQDYMVESEKMASLAQVAVGVAHEINNPLFIIKNYFTLLKDRYEDEDFRIKVDKIEKELKRIVNIVASLLSFSKVRTISSVFISINNLIEETAVLLSHNFSEKQISLQVNLTPRDIVVRADENKIKQVLINLLMNSIDAVLFKGKIWIDLNEGPGKNFVTLAVRDNGYGIPENIRSQIFNPFFSTKMSKNNTGLGLTISKHLIEEIGGTIVCAGSKDNLTEFRLSLPCKARR